MLLSLLLFRVTADAFIGGECCTDFVLFEERGPVAMTPSWIDVFFENGVIS